MKLFNYFKPFGVFTDAYQLIPLDPAPTDRQAKKLFEEADKLLIASWARREAFLQKRIGDGEEVDMVKERDAFFPKTVDGMLMMPLQYVQDYLVRKVAAAQNNVSIHNQAEVAELKEVFEEYGVQVLPSFKGLVFQYINWTAKGAQKPKLLVHAKDAQGEEVCIRFEAAGELCQKFMNALLILDISEGTVFDLSVEAVDPAIERNRKAGKKVVDEGKYVNHNLTLKTGTTTHSGHPPKGQKFNQKPTIEYMETLFKQAQMEIDRRTQKKAA